MKKITTRRILGVISAIILIILLCSLTIKQRVVRAEKLQPPPRPVNPLDYASQKDELITAQDIVSFILRWLYPETGLIPTEIAKTDTKNPNWYLCSTYVSAIAHQILFMSGQLEESAKLAETVRSLAAKRDLPNTLDVRTGLSADSFTTAGPNAYWGISFTREYQLTNDAKWLKAAKQIGNFLLGLRTPDGGIRMDPYFGNTEYYVKSTEENLGCYAFFNLLFEITGDKKYEIARNNILKWLTTSGVYHKEEGSFSIGTFKDKVDPIYGLDVNTLAIIILGPETLNATEGDYIFGGSETAQKVAQSFQRTRVTVDYTHPNQEVIKNVKGFDFTDERGRPGRPKTLSPEFSSQAALAYLVMAKDAGERGDLVSANKFLEMTKDILENLARISARVDGAASLPYATSAGIRRFTFDNWYTPRPEANISGAWAAFPLAGFNPFAKDGFELRNSLKNIAPWMTAVGKITPFPKAFPERIPEKIISEVELVAEKEAVREILWEKPVVYYKVRYEKVEEGLQLARRRLEVTLITGYSCWIDSLIDPAYQDYDVIEITKDGLTFKRKFAELPKKLTRILKEEYLYYDEEIGIEWRLAPKYNLNVDYSRGTYYAFEVDENYQIVRQFKSEVDVPKPNRADLRGIKSQYKSTAGLPEGHKIMRYFLALEVDKDYKIVKTYENIDDLPALVSKVPINKETYKRYTEAGPHERKNIIAAGIIPDKEGRLATVEAWKYYYTQVLALDTSRRLFTRTYSKESGNEIISGTRMLLADWEVDEKTKINTIKYEQGLMDSMVMKARRPTLGEKPLLTEPIWIYVGHDIVKQEEEEISRRQRQLLLQIEEEKDAQVRQELIMEFDRLRWELSWHDKDGYLHVIYYGLKIAEDTLADLEKAKKRAEASPREYISILGCDEEGRDLRDSYGRVWLKVINKITERILHIEVYDIAGNLKFLLAGDVEIDLLFKTVTAETRTDVKYDRITEQMLGSHSYFIDENGDWVSDVHEGIFKGYTPDGKHFIIERRVFLKDKSGNIIFKDNRAQFAKKFEYYTPEGDIAAQIAGDIITVINYESGTEVVRQVYIDITNEKSGEKNENLTDLIKDKVWVRRFRPTGKILKFKDVLIENLTSLPENRRVNGAVAILNRLGVEEIERISDRLLLEKSEVTTNLSGTPAAENTSTYYMFYEPGDYLGRERIKIQGSTIRIPVAWIPRTQIAAKTLNFNLSGELVSIGETMTEIRADAIVPRVDLLKLTVLGIEADTFLPVAREKVYRLVTGEDGLPYFTNTVDIIRMSYLIPEDMLGRELVIIKYSMIWNETKLHPGGALKTKQNWLKQEILTEAWLDDKGRQRQRVIGKRKGTVVKEWYKQGLTLKRLRAVLIKELLEDAIKEGKLKLQDIPTTFKELEDALKEKRIKARYLPVKIEELKEAMDKLKVAPFGVLPGYHIIKADKTKGEIKCFAGLVEYPRSKFAHQGINVPYEPLLKPFKLPEGPAFKGFKYEVLNSDNINYEIHTLNGQLIIRERPYIQVRLVNMFPIKGVGEQTEYYNPLVPYSYLEPIKIERYFKPGKQPEEEKPGVSTIGVFRKNATTYHENGWQTQVLMERRPLDIDHWIKSEIFFDKEGMLKYKKQHIESRTLPMETTDWRNLLVILIGLFTSSWLMSRVNHKRMKVAREKTIKQAEERIKAGVLSKGSILPFTREKLKGLEKQLTYFSSIISRELIDELKAECIRVYENNQPPVRLKELTDKIYRPLIEDRLRYLGAEPSNYTAGINNILARIFMRLGREEINLKNLYAQEIKEFENWSSKFGHHFNWTDIGLFKEDCIIEEPVLFSKDNILIITLFRLVFDESIEFKATAPSFRYFLFDKSLNMLISAQKALILQELQSDTWTLLEALRPGYVKELELTKESIFTYEDVEELFKGKKRGVLQTFSELTGQTKEQKLNYLAGGETQITAKDIKSYKSYTWLKTYSDRQGLLQFIINLSRLWVPLIPLFIAVFAGGVLMGFKSLPLTSQINVISSSLTKILSPLTAISISNTTLFLQATIFLGMGILLSAFLFKLTLGGFKFSAQTLEYQKITKRAIRQFRLLFIPATYMWGLFSVFIINWTTVVIFKSTFLNGGWELLIHGSTALLSLVFVVASFYSLFYVMISIFTYFEGKREGIGQVTNWAQAKKNFEESKKRFIDVMIPAKSKSTAAYKEEIWKIFWNAMIRDLHKDCKLSDNEQRRLLYSKENVTPNFDKQPKNEETQERIQKYINSWLMEIPKAEFWTDLPTLTVTITAFNESVSILFNQLNASDYGASETRLNYLISRYPADWNEFVERLSEKDLGRWITKDELKRNSGLRKLPENLSVSLKEKIRRWVNIITQPLEKTLIEVLKIRDAFMLYAQVCYPETQDEDIKKMVDDKIQILLNYEGYHKPFTRDEDRVSLRKLMREFPHLEVYWDSVRESYVSGEGQDRLEFRKGTDAGLHRYNPMTKKIELFQLAPQTIPPKAGKPTGLSQAFPFIKGETVLFFDANAAVRIEDAVKIPVALS